MKRFLISISLLVAFAQGMFADQPLGYELDPQIVERRHCHALQEFFNDALNLQFEQIIFEYNSVGPDLKTPVRLTASISMNPAVYNKEVVPRGLILYNQFTTAKHRERTSQDAIDDIAFYMSQYQDLIAVSADLYGWTLTEDKPQAFCCPEITGVESIDAWDAAMIILQQEGYEYEGLPTFNVGYSAGGFSALAVQKYISEKRPDISFKLTAAGGAPFDITTVYENYVKTNSTGYKCALPLMMVAYKENYKMPFEYKDVFLPPLCDNIQEWILSKDYDTWEINERIGLEANVDEILTPTACDYTQGMGRVIYEKFRDNSLCGPWCNWQPDTDTKYFIFHSEGDLYMHYFVGMEMVNYLKKKGCNVSTDFGNWGNHVEYAFYAFTLETILEIETVISDEVSDDIIDDIDDNMDKITDLSDVIDFGGSNGMVSSIKSVSDIPNYDSRKYYTLDGREISGKPQKGIYIHQGKKQVVR